MKAGLRITSCTPKQLERVSAQRVFRGNRLLYIKENGEVYVPLREMLEKAVSEDEGITDIKWNDGTINVVVACYQDESGAYQFKIGGNQMKVKHISDEEIENVSFDTDGVVISISLIGSPILLHSTTYVIIKDINYMLYGFTNRRDANKKLFELTYHIYDKNGNIISEFEPPIILPTSQYANNTPEYTIDRFFYLFGDGDFENMKRYCTKNCINTYFKDNAVFGMKKAALTEMNIDPLEYAKSSNGFNVLVTVNMIPGETSVYDPSETSTSFYVILQRQNDGKYLIDNFANSLYVFFI